MDRFSILLLLLLFCCCSSLSFISALAYRHHHVGGGDEQPLSRIAIHKATFALHDSASVKASPLVLGLKARLQGEDTQWVTVEIESPAPSEDDWIDRRLFSCKLQCPRLCCSTLLYLPPNNGTIHVVVGGGGYHLSNFSDVKPSWSLYKDYDYGFGKANCFQFTISRDYKDVLACVPDGCEPITLASN